MNAPIPSYESGLHLRLITRSPTAPAELFYYITNKNNIISLFQRMYPKIDKEELWDIVTDAILGIIDEPDKYKPQKGSLLSFIKMDIEGDIKNFLAKRERREKKGKITVELCEITGNTVERIDSPEDQLIKRETLDQLHRTVNRIFPDDADREMADLILEGERKTEIFAKILKITDWPIEKQEREVKRHKDRIKKRMKRDRLID
jgi:RNA polymerase sigma-70 factor (ECF subfamily)